MPKRPANESLSDAQPFAKAPSSSSKRGVLAEDEMGEFEDAWEDELESDEDIVDPTDENGAFISK